jgi:hypothetical protein
MVKTMEILPLGRWFMYQRCAASGGAQSGIKQGGVTNPFETVIFGDIAR